MSDTDGFTTTTIAVESIRVNSGKYTSDGFSLYAEIPPELPPDYVQRKFTVILMADTSVTIAGKPASVPEVIAFIRASKAPTAVIVQDFKQHYGSVVSVAFQ